MSINLLIVVILLGGFFFGKLFHRLGLPTVLGMTLWGVALGFFSKSQIPPLIWELAPFLKSAALITILLRAGLGIQKQTLRKVGKSALFMSFIPCIIEGTALLFLSRFLFSFSWLEAGMLGFMLSAVSPAVVVPSMLSLKEKGYGKKNEIPTLVLAGASLDDVFAITLFTLFLDLGKGVNPDYLRSLFSIP
ncbi:MAG: peptidase, partial [Spirochaetae bacterium HGW-Spirochaetae-6]